MVPDVDDVVLEDVSGHVKLHQKFSTAGVPSVILEDCVIHDGHVCGVPPLRIVPADGEGSQVAGIDQVVASSYVAGVPVEVLARHLNPEIVYLQESLAGDNGEVITHLQSWLRQDVVLVVGADGGHGGLADSESEAEHIEKKEQWWEREDRVGLGRGVVVVEGLRVGDDWARRVENRE